MFLNFISCTVLVHVCFIMLHSPCLKLCMENVGHKALMSMQGQRSTRVWPDQEEAVNEEVDQAGG